MPLPTTTLSIAESPSRPHITQLDGLRGIAILMVFVFHAFKANLLWMGVDLFFVLSGFLITGILLSQKQKPFGAYIAGFYSRRVRRILPAYVVILAISAAIFGVAWLRYWYLYLGAMNLLVPMDLTYLKTLPLWSLAVEEQFYLLWPLAVFFLSRKNLTTLTIVLLVVAPALRFICEPMFASGYAVYMLAPFRMDTLAAGALLALVWPDLQTKLTQNPRVKQTATRGFAGLLGIGLIVALVINGKGIVPTSGNRIGGTVLLEATLWISVGMFMLALMGVGKKALSSRLLTYFGRISYSIYLFHQTALYLAPKNNGFIAFAISILYATLMWFLIESPVLNFGRSQRAPEPVQADRMPVTELG